MLTITGTKKEIEHIKSVMWCSSDCPICENPSKNCIKDKSNCDNIDEFYKCIEENILFNISK